MFALVGKQTLLRRIALRAIANPAQPAHYAGRIGPLPEERPVFLTPIAQDQPVGLVAKLSH